MNFRSPRSLPIALAACVLLLSTLANSVPAQQALPIGPPSAPGLPGVGKPPSPDVQKAGAQWQNAVRLHKAKKYAEAINAYHEFLKSVKDAGLNSDAAAPAYQNLTAIYRTQGKAAELLEALKSWSALAPNNASLHAEMSSLYALPKVQQFEDAAREARRCLALKPTAALASAAHSTLGIVAVAKKDYVTAEQEFGACIRLTANNAQMYYNYALALVELKKYPAALTAMLKATTLNPKMTGAWYYVGLLNETQQKFPESIKAFRQAVHLAPTDPTIHFDLARVEVRSNDIDGAITEYLVVLELSPDSIPARTAVAQLYIRLNNFSAARVHYAELVRLSPKNAQALAGLAECETQLASQPQELAAREKFLRQAEEHFRAASTIEPRYLTGQSSLAHFYERTGSFVKAQEIYRKQIDADPSNFIKTNALAETYMMERKPDEAIVVWRKFRDLHPDNPAPYTKIADAFEAQAKWPDALAEWNLLLKQKLISGTAASVMVSIGKDLARAGKNKEAVDQLQAVLKMDTSGSDAPQETRVAVVATLKAERLEAMQELAQIAERENNLDDAIRWQQQIKAEEAALAERAHRPVNSDTYLTLARLYQRAKKPDQAIKELDALTQTRQSNREKFAKAYEELAQVYESQSRFDDAVSAYRRSAQFAKEPINARLRAAEDYQRSNRLPLAVSEFEAIRKDFPKEGRVLAPLALAYRQAGRDEDALQVYDALLLSDSRATWARDQKAVVLTHLKRYSDARALYEDQLSRNPQDRQLYADIAFVFQSEGKADAFLDWATPRLDKAPANPTLMAVILDEAIRQKKEDQAWATLKASAVKYKSQRAVVEATAGLMSVRGKKEESAALYRLLATQYPRDLSLQVALADQLFAAGHKDEASKLYTDLIARTDLAPGERLTVRRQFARCCFEQGNPAEALVQLQEIVRLDPNDYDSASRLALQLEASGRGIEAIPVLLKLASSEIYDATVRAQIRTKLGNLYAKMGNKTEAAVQYRKALELNPKDAAAIAALGQLPK